jgi:hypothetical protein
MRVLRGREEFRTGSQELLRCRMRAGEVAIDAPAAWFGPHGSTAADVPGGELDR